MLLANSLQKSDDNSSKDQGLDHDNKMKYKYLLGHLGLLITFSPIYCKRIKKCINYIFDPHLTEYSWPALVMSMLYLSLSQAILAWFFSLHCVDYSRLIIDQFIRRKNTWRFHDMEMLFTLLSLCAGNLLVISTHERPVMQNFDNFFDVFLIILFEQKFQLPDNWNT